MKRNAGRPNVVVTTGGRGVAAHAGARLLCDLADELGLGHGLSAAMAPTKKRRRGHDRGQVLVDLAVAIADGATTISDLRVLADQPALFGDVASVPTTWRTLEAIDAAAQERIASARARARAEAWAAGLDPGFYVIDLDATLVGAHSEKEGAAPNYKHGFGFSPLLAFLDATGELLAARLRPGNAAPGNAEDHVIVLDDALAQLPVDPLRCEVIARTDSAGCSHCLHPGLLGARRALHCRSQAQCRGGGCRDRGAQKPLEKCHLGRWGRRARVRRGGRDHRPGGCVALGGGHPDDRPA